MFNIMCAIIFLRVVVVPIRTENYTHDKLSISLSWGFSALFFIYWNFGSDRHRYTVAKAVRLVDAL